MSEPTIPNDDHKAAISLSILAWAKPHRIEPLAYVSARLTALSSEPVDLKSLRLYVWIAAHPEYFLRHRRDEALAAARARKRRREEHRAESKVRLTAGRSHQSPRG